MTDLVVGIILIFVLGGASYGTWKQMKQGGCSGCSGCKGGCPSQGCGEKQEELK